MHDGSETPEFVWYCTDVKGINKLSCSAKFITVPLSPEIFTSIFTFSLQAGKSKETGLPETSMIARKWADFPERIKWWKVWCPVKGRILWESVWVAKGQHSREAASAKCSLEGMREEWDKDSVWGFPISIHISHLTFPFLLPVRGSCTVT